MALEWHFERIQWQLFRRKSREIPCIFPCYREFARERFARDWILRQSALQTPRSQAASTSPVTPVTFLATATDAAMASALFGGRIR